MFSGVMAFVKPKRTNKKEANRENNETSKQALPAGGTIYKKPATSNHGALQEQYDIMPQLTQSFSTSCSSYLSDSNSSLCIPTSPRSHQHPVHPLFVTHNEDASQSSFRSVVSVSEPSSCPSSPSSSTNTPMRRRARSLLLRRSSGASGSQGRRSSGLPLHPQSQPRLEALVAPAVKPQPPTAPAGDQLQRPTLQHHKSLSFRLRKRNRALSDVDFDNLLVLSRGWTFDPSERSLDIGDTGEEEDATTLPSGIHLTHNDRLKNRALCALDFERFIFQPTTPRLGVGSSSSRKEDFETEDIHPLYRS
jgi:hypothetical protein